tara:strand:+ start:208 stop:516 length:309 start_codon:yes stop_codon:yes gene_type:complete
MPTYDFLNTETGEITEHIMSWRDLEDFRLNNPHLKQQILGAPMTVGGHGDRVKTDDGMKEVLNKIASANPGSPMDRHRQRGVKEVKTKEIVKKHLDIQSRKK